MISVPMHMRMFALIRIRVHFVAVFTLYGAASTDLLGVLSVRRAKRRFSSMVGRGGGSWCAGCISCNNGTGLHYIIRINV